MTTAIFANAKQIVLREIFYQVEHLTTFELIHPFADFFNFFYQLWEPLLPIDLLGILGQVDSVDPFVASHIATLHLKDNFSQLQDITEHKKEVEMYA